MFSPSSICSSCRRAILESARSSRTLRYSESRSTTRTFASATTSPSASRKQRFPSSRRLEQQNYNLSRSQRTRPFSYSVPRLATILNPRKDEDGNAMEVEITPRAAKRLQEIMKKDANPNLCLRVQVESGGCHGFQYLMSLADIANISQEEDTVFESTEAVLSDDSNTAKVVMDESSLELLKGSKVDYTQELIGSQFKIVDNPLATSSCGCGTSFDIKV